MCFWTGGLFPTENTTQKKKKILRGLSDNCVSAVALLL